MNPEAGGLRHPQEGTADRSLLEVLLLEGWTPAVQHRLARTLRNNAWTIVVFLAVNVVAIGGLVWYAARDAGLASASARFWEPEKKRYATGVIQKKDGTVLKKQKKGKKQQQ